MAQLQFSSKHSFDLSKFSVNGRTPSSAFLDVKWGPVHVKFDLEKRFLEITIQWLLWQGHIILDGRDADQTPGSVPELAVALKIERVTKEKGPKA